MPRELIPLRGRRPSSTVMFEVVGELTAGDIIALAAGGEPVRMGPPPLKTVKSIHRRIAFLLAQGKSAVEVATLVGRTPQRIRDLQQDPAFADLVATCNAEQEELLVEETARARNLAIEILEMSMEEIRDRLEDEATRRGIPIAELRQLLTSMADRSIMPPKQVASAAAVPTQITFNIAGNAQLKDEPETIDQEPAEPATDVEEDK